MQVLKNQKIPLIIDCALAIMRDHGDQGLTMRQVAARANMSLGNLQYYFRNKNALLKGMVDHYFGQCDGLLANHLLTSTCDHPQERIREMIAFGLSHGQTLNEICKIFRQFWAISARNDEIHLYMQAYYTRYAGNLSELLAPLAVEPDSISKVVSLLVPYFEGYAITSSSLPLPAEEILDMLTDMVCDILEVDASA